MLDYQQLFDASPVATCVFAHDGTPLAYNLAFQQTFGNHGKQLFLAPAKPPEPVEDNPPAQSRQQIPQSVENYQVREKSFPPNGARRQMFLEYRRRIRGQNSQPDHFICQYIEITRRKVREQRLRRTEERYKLSQHHAGYGVWDWNIKTDDFYWSEQIGYLLGYADKEVNASMADYLAAIHPEDRDRVHQAVKTVLESGGEYDIKHRVVWPDGAVRWIRETGNVIRAADGTPLNMIGVARDVTEHHLANMALEENAAQLSQAQQIAHLGHWSWDVASGRLSWSDEVYRIFGYQPHEIEPTYEDFMDTLHPEDVAAMQQSIQDVFSTGRAYSIDHRIIRHDGPVIWVHEEAVPVIDEEGRPVQLTGTVQDITERKRLEQQLADKIDQAELANFAKSTFLSNISHELRTPLNAILGFAQILDMEDLPDSTTQGIKEIMRSGWHLLDLVDDLLDLSRIETDHIDLKIEPILLKPLLHECQSMVEPLLAERGLSFIDTYQNCDLAILADRRRLKQIIVNLLSNAMKYNQTGGEIEVLCESRGDKLRIIVRDTGQGIPPEHMERVFTPFDRLGKEGIEESGTGIGLTLVKKLAGNMHGETGVESTPGEGSRFWIEFSIARPNDSFIAERQPAYTAADKTIQSAKVKVLYVEDNSANLRLIEGLFARKRHLHLLSTTTAAAGLEMARRELPDLILMDIKLPDMNGFEALTHLRSSPKTASIPVIAVSAVAHEHDIATGLNAGFYRYLTKPLNLLELEEAMQYALQDTKRNINSPVKN